MYLRFSFYKIGYGGLSLSIEGPSKADIECHDNEDGSCLVTYRPTEPGLYIINVKFADKHVPGSLTRREINLSLTLYSSIHRADILFSLYLAFSKRSIKSQYVLEVPFSQ